jgi:hypothetical protein
VPYDNEESGTRTAAVFLDTENKLTAAYKSRSARTGEEGAAGC